MPENQTQSTEYLLDKTEIDNYLSDLAESLSICIESLLDGEKSKYIYHSNKIKETASPDIFQGMHIVIKNIIKNAFFSMENLYIYLECQNNVKIDEYCLAIKNDIDKMVASFVSLLRIVYKFEEEYEYLKILEEQYPYLMQYIDV